MQQSTLLRLRTSKGARCCLWAAVAVLLILIFCFSAQNGERSSGLSDGPARLLMALMYPDTLQLSAEENQLLYELCQHLVRKAGHFSEFALLAFHLCLLLEACSRPLSALMAWALTTAYAATDELHQLFVDARGASVKDVCIDSIGALAGVLAASALVLWLLHRQHRKEAQSE